MDVSYSKKASSAERSAAVDGSATTGTSMSAALNLSRSRPRQPRINLVKVEGASLSILVTCPHHVSLHFLILSMNVISCPRSFLVTSSRIFLGDILNQ